MKNILNKESLFNKIQKIIQTDINPQLAIHGGKISLLKIDENKFAVLKFSGGCNGCAMAKITLKNGIEKKLLKLFPKELNGIKDSTEHNHGIHSYY